MRNYSKPTNPKKSGVSQITKTTEKDVKKKKETPKNKTSKKRVYKSQKVTPTKDSDVKDLYIRRNDTPKEKKHPEYGTSKLETHFAKNFLGKLGIEFQYQFKAESIKRFFDFYIPSCNLIIELNGGYWHSDPRLYEGKELTPTQKKNKRVDKEKKKWADEHRIPIIYIWEKDVNETPQTVMKKLIEDIEFYREKHNKELLLKQRPNNKNNNT